MAYLIRDWRCPDCGYVHEEFTKASEVFTTCPACGGGSCAVKLAMPKIANMRMGVDPAGCPTAAAKWEKAHKTRKAP